MSDAPIVTMKTIYDELQVVKRHVYRSEYDYRQVQDLKVDMEAAEKRIGALENRMSAHNVVHGIMVLAIGALTVAALSA